MRRRFPRSKAFAYTRIRMLFRHARLIYPSHPRLSERAISIARNISTRTRTRIPRKNRMLFCRRCGNPLLSPEATTVRMRSGRQKHLVVRCRRCGWIRRIPVVETKTFKMKSSA
ncbi:MAG: hypothetical protein ACETVV_03810 [Nitrososphaeria archaeon]